MPVCLAHPGTLPVPNRRAIEMTILLGHALGCEIVEHAVFHRKHYFYPDLPKGYQISQYDEPLCVDGAFTLPTSDGDLSVSIVRAHLEEDAAKNVHMGGAGPHRRRRRTLVDFNRAGTPLVEIVTGPDLHSSEHAKRFLQLLGKRSSSSESRTPRWRKARSGSTSTSRCGPRARMSCAHAPSSRT
jgi:aspartyl-tRNA(Asn)/glutamyl-tRNA(Gln) amidotransferase subunit B